jgi:hypothetical protein
LPDPVTAATADYVVPQSGGPEWLMSAVAITSLTIGGVIGGWQTDFTGSIFVIACCSLIYGSLLFILFRWWFNFNSDKALPDRPFIWYDEHRLNVAGTFRADWSDVIAIDLILRAGRHSDMSVGLTFDVRSNGDVVRHRVYFDCTTWWPANVYQDLRDRAAQLGVTLMPPSDRACGYLAQLGEDNIYDQHRGYA